MTGLGARIKARRKEKGMSMQSLAKAAGCSKTYLWQIENERSSNVGGNILLKLSSVLEVSVSQLATGSDAIVPVDVPVKINASLAKLADTEALKFNEVVCLVKVAEVIEAHTSQFKLKPVHMDWKKLYQGIKEWL